ncbi:MAG TPA: hypothetical protein VLV86_01225, partial [Vicinamibacterales bacterium]|nr:hypothetical protein [Vicinamibacterales bacterium]
LMNLSVRFIDRLVQSPVLQRFSPERLWRRAAGYRRNLAYVGGWAVAFGLMSGLGLSDSHSGQWLPFWQEACSRGRARACAYTVQLESTLCRAGSGWACNELGNIRSARDGDAIAALASWQRGCEAGFRPACANAEDGGRRTASPTLADYPILLRGSKGPVTDASPVALYSRACEQQWPDACRFITKGPAD